MATTSGLNLSTPRVIAKTADSPKPALTLKGPCLSLNKSGDNRMRVRPIYAAPDQISQKVEESIKKAEEACSGEPASGECVAAWDEVEELSAAASHARDKQKGSDPLETFCKDNAETDECRTYDS